MMLSVIQSHSITISSVSLLYMEFADIDGHLFHYSELTKC